MQSDESPGRLKRWVQGLRRRLRQRRGTEPRTRVEIRCGPSHKGGWWICPQPLRPGDIAYSIDRASDLRLERVLMEDYGARVHLFDPDPETATRADAKGLLDDLRLFTARVGPPAAAGVASGSGDDAEVPTTPLGALLERLGHRRLDLLKIDVNGVEPIVRELAELGVDVRQLLVRFPPAGTEAERERVEALVEALHASGFRIYAITPDGRRYSFLRTDFEAV